MSWVKLDDRFPRHRRVRELRRNYAAKWLHVVALCHCAEHLTDGVVDEIAFTQIASDGEIPRASANRAAEKLEEAGLWVRHGNGWMIRDYLDYNPTSCEVKAQREARAEAGRLGGIRSGESRRGEANTEANASPGASAVVEANANPVPVPLPVVQNKTSTSTVPNDLEQVTDTWTFHAPPLIHHRDSYLSDPKTRSAVAVALRKYPAEVISEAIANYATVVAGAEYRWSHSWPLIEFLKRGLDRFVPEANPLRNFRIGPNMDYDKRNVTAAEMRESAARLRAERLDNERKALAP